MAYKEVKTESKLSDAKPKLEYAFSIGCDVSAACLYADISRDTYYRWIDKYPELSDRFELLREKPILKAHEAINDKLNEGDEHVAKWYLERRSKDFKPTNKTEHEGSVGVTHQWTIQPVKPKE